MATIIVTISPEGALSPAQISVNAGDTVSFHAEADAVLCVDPASLFGSERFEIPGRSTVGLVVQPHPPASFQYIIRMGNLAMRCDGSRDKTSGGGGTGGEGGPG